MARNEGVIAGTAWNVLAGASALAMAWAARQAAGIVWSQFSDAEAPVNPADREATWTEALAWAALAGVTAGLARVLGRRGAAMAWEQATGDKAPGT